MTSSEHLKNLGVAAKEEEERAEKTKKEEIHRLNEVRESQTRAET